MFLPPNEQGNSKKGKWADNHIEFIAENKDDPYFLAVYADRSLKNKDGCQQTGYGAVGYHLGRTAFKMKGALGEHTEVFDAEMTGLQIASKSTKHFILNMTPHQ